MIGVRKVTIGAAKTHVATSPMPAGMVIFQNDFNNTHKVWVGDSSVSASSDIGYMLINSATAPGTVTFGPFPLKMLDLQDFWVDGTQNEIVQVIYVIF